MMAKPRSRLTTFFDANFREMITPQIISLIYILAIVGSVAFVIVQIVAGFGRSNGTGVVMLLMSPLILAFGLLGIRICMELLIVVFRVERHLRELSRIAQQQPHTD